MKRRSLIVALSVVVVFQSLVLAGEYLNAVYPLWTGREIRIRTVPVDPRSLFRGNYARLRYEISSITAEEVSAVEILRQGEPVYVKLKADADGLYVFDGASLHKPASGTFIRGRIQTKSRHGTSARIRVRYGIEAYFAPKDKALALEKDLRDKGVARIMIATNGKATLKEILAE